MSNRMQNKDTPDTYARAKVADDLVAIVLATYNGENYLAEQLLSIEDQTHAAWHLLATDDMSTDATRSILDEFSKRHPGQVTIVEHADGGGACANFLFGLAEAVKRIDAPYYAFCDQDDWWDARKLALSLDTLHALEAGNDEPALVFSDAHVTAGDLELIAVSFFQFTGVDPSRVNLNELLVQNPISGAGMLFNKALAELSVEVDYNDSIWMHDQWVGLVAACFGKIAAIYEPLFFYRQHDDNAMGAIQMSWRAIADKARIAKGSLSKKQRQANYLLNSFEDGLPEEKRRLLSRFVAIPAKTKPLRMADCMRYSFLMNGTLRNIGLLAFI